MTVIFADKTKESKKLVVKKNIDDMDVFDSMRALLDDGVDLADPGAVEKALINPYRGTALSERFVNWCIKAAKANRDAGGLERHAFGGCSGFVPLEDDDPSPF